MFLFVGEVVRLAFQEKFESLLLNIPFLGTSTENTNRICICYCYCFIKMPNIFRNINKNIKEEERLVYQAKYFSIGSKLFNLSDSTLCIIQCIQYLLHFGNTSQKENVFLGLVQNIFGTSTKQLSLIS